MQTHTKLQSSWVVILDLLCLVLSICLAVTLRFGSEDVAQYVTGRLDGWVLFIGSILVANYLAGSYRIQYSLSRFNLMVTWLFSVGMAVLLLSVTSYAWLKILLGRGVLGLAVILYSASSLYLRLVVFRSLFKAGGIVRRALIVLDGGNEKRLRDYIENPFVLPQHRVIAWIDLCSTEERKPAAEGRMIEGVPVIDATPEELAEVVRSLSADMLVLDRAALARFEQYRGALREIRFSGGEALTPLTVSEVFCGRSPLDLVDEADLMRTGLDAGTPVIFRVKRIIDLFSVVLLSFIFVPLGMLVALLIKVSDPRHAVIYSQSRVGQFGKVFQIRKFRTMRPDAEALTGAVWSSDDDPRITPLGRILRTFRLDEIPQLWNVLRGEMSLVGPRPERPELASGLAAVIPFYREREYAMPGVTGWAQIHCAYSNTIESSRRKLEYDLFYLKNMSLSLDLQIILRTLRIVLLGKEKNL